MRAVSPSLLIILGGVSAALHVGKLPPALPVLQQGLQITLVEAGFLLSLVQLAGMSAGLAVGLAADALGLKRTMVAGLSLLCAASLAGAWSTTAPALLAWRAMEGLGFLLASMPAPGLIRRRVAPEQLRPALGLWGAYMPTGMALALLMGPLWIERAGWPAWWCMLGVLSGLMAAALAWALPPDPARTPAALPSEGWTLALRQTLCTAGPWLLALAFAVYSAQWLAVIGFLPSIYAQAGWSGTGVGAATALVAAANIVGNVASGRLLQRGVPPERLLQAGYIAMSLGAVLAFAPVWPAAPARLAVVGPYAAALLFSMFGGLVPGTLFVLAVRLAPGERAVSTTVGWMQQWSSLGQFVGPPLVAWVAVRTGGWAWSGAVTAAWALAGILLTFAMARLLRPPRMRS